MTSHDGKHGDERKVRSAWGRYLRGYRWNHYAHLTPRSPSLSAEALRRAFEDGFIRRLTRWAQEPVPYVAALERSPGGVLHIHALLAGTGEQTVADVRRAWKLGISRVTVYQSSRGAAWYVAKTLEQPDESFPRLMLSRSPFLPLDKIADHRAAA